jgi:asparagine synthase (glutamine-hydrolysing)
MCGISGFYSPNKIFAEKDLRAMNDSLAHRGPDAEGAYYRPAIGLAHRRLSILDLSEKGNQPMVSHNKRYVMVYNGEVYNFNEIANELRSVSVDAKSKNFNSSTDSEVILEAFSTWGPEFVDKLNGMFVIAIYDIKEDCLYIFRDRLGIKPLYYFFNGTDFAFASELKALLKIPVIPKVVDREAVRYFLHLGFIPAPHSIYESVRKMEPGHFIKISKTGIDFQRYWSLKYAIKKDIITNDRKALVQLTELMMSSVQFQLKSDVPFGVFLSGGIDSSLVTALAMNLSNTMVNTFSIGFQENKFNESVHAKSVAKYLGTSHHEFIVSYRDAIKLIPQLDDTYDEPFADSSAIPTMLVSKLAKQFVTVTLSGEGGDELFMGYGAYRWANRLNNPLLQMMKTPLSYAFSKMNDRFKRVSRLLDYSADDYLQSHIFSQEQYYFSQKELQGLLLPPSNNSLIFNSVMATETGRKLGEAEKQALFDMQYYLPGDLLAKVDRASMHYGLETRVPYLDHRIVEFALNLSPNLKIKNGISKYILKEVLFQYVPKKFFERPKQGFAIPLKLWLRDELRFLVEDYLNKSTVEDAGFVNYSVVESLKKDFNNGVDYLYPRIWALIVLHKWYKNLYNPV